MQKQRIAIPVKCQNGHEAIYYYRIMGLDVAAQGVDPDSNCGCPKWGFSQGWRATGPARLETE